MYQELDGQISTFLSRPKYLLDSATIGEAIEFMRTHKIGSVIVVNEDVELVGIFTERDVLMKIAGKGEDILSNEISLHMTKNPQTLNEHQTAREAAQLMQKGNFRHVPIVNDLNKPIGIISIKDLFIKS